ncbi:pyruvate dehydrogenase [Pandoraea terrae]|uniref:Pyruvate dehydrogenase E1 component n=1 Tax=Pandoraea terrae TaxID=1537710 RepID=A0A5E4Y4F5_9BURK|nr:pyruvate dehydrogenase (acetyl-transferring), homodimeric type [Pandoraea terrae]VVE43480.1 pyruvate dehydrogenase [Pandoraea terrae]
MSLNDDTDIPETSEWLDALKAVQAHRGANRANYIVNRLVDEARRDGVYIPRSLTTAYCNTIPPAQEEKSSGDRAIEHRLRSIIRWNALAIILRANKESSELGGHIASFQSAATLYDIGFGHFWHAPTDSHGGDLVYIQGHCSPGIYARAFVEGRLTEQQLLNYRQETGGQGIPSYPHPWLMPDFWQFPTVSMGLGPLMAIYQARFLKYLQGRGLADTAPRKVWAFMGDGEMDEPESLGAISLAGREGLDNLIFVINCNLQRLDGPVRGNGKIVQELESVFRGAGWNVIKVLWGSSWDRLLAKDKSGKLLQLMEECVDGEYQDFKSKSGAYVREHFFGRYPETKALVEDMSDEDIWNLSRGGHDPEKVFAAYAAAVKHTGQPTLILPKTVKGYGMGESGEGQMIAHQAKKMTQDALRGFRDRFQIPVSDEDLPKVPFIKLPEDSPEMKYLHERRAALGGYLPQRRQKSSALTIPPLSAFQRLLDSTGEREISTTMAFVQMLGTLVRDKVIGKNIVPIVPDESRTFGMEGMFRQLGIWSSQGQLYKPQDADQLMYYRESKDGQVLQEGINEGGAMSSWVVAATSYSTNNVPMIPFYIYYSMFGLQRVGDLAWLAGDIRARGFLLGGTAGRTTLNGEGLQHEDGHSHILAGTIPNCISYDPTFAYEVVTIIREGMRRMYEAQEDVFYYVTLMNENYSHPGLADAGEGAEEGILKGLYKLKAGGKAKKGLRVQLMGSGTILREVIAAAELLQSDWGVTADLWSATSYNELRRDGMATERWNLLHPTEARRKSWVEACLDGNEGPVIASTDYMRNYADQIREYVQAAGRRYVVLGTDGFGRSDYRVKLRRFFEVDRYYVTVAALKALADEGSIKPAVVAEAIAKYGLDTECAAPWTV